MSRWNSQTETLQTTVKFLLELCQPRMKALTSPFSMAANGLLICFPVTKYECDQRPNKRES